MDILRRGEKKVLSPRIRLVYTSRRFSLYDRERSFLFSNMSVEHSTFLRLIISFVLFNLYHSWFSIFGYIHNPWGRVQDLKFELGKSILHISNYIHRFL